MKALVLFITLTCVIIKTHAQETIISKNGIPVLPEAGEWGLGFDATPFFDVFKNAFNNDSSFNSTSADFTRNHPLTIYGKRVIDASTMWRLSARLYFGSETQKYVTGRDSAGGAGFVTPQFVEDEVKISRSGIVLGFGIEKRRGKGRIQGYYGPEINLGFGTGKTTQTFANPFSADNQAPSTSIPGQTPGSRVLEVKNGAQFNAALRGFIGVEYFFMAKASIGAELGWGKMLASRGEPQTRSEFWDPALNSGAGGVVTRVQPGGSDGRGKFTSFGIDTDRALGALNLLFYF